MFDSVRRIRLSCTGAWLSLAQQAEIKEVELSKGVRDFSSFLPVRQTIKQIAAEFYRATKPFTIKPLNRKLINSKLIELESFLEKDHHYLAIWSRETNVAARLHLTIIRTREFLNDDYDNLPETLRGWIHE